MSPPLVVLALMALCQDQWVPQELIEGICIERNLLASHPGAHISDPLLGRPCISVELHDYLQIEFSHGCHKWCLVPVGYLSLKVRKLIVP